MSPSYLPWFAVAFAVISFLARTKAASSQPASKPAPGSFLALAVVAVAGVLLGMKYDIAYVGLQSASWGFGLGILLSALCEGLGFTGLRQSGRATPMALAVVAASFAPMLGANAPLGMVFGAAVSAWLADFGTVEGENPWGMRCAAIAGAIVLANLMGSYVPGEYGAHAGTLLGLTLVLGWIVSSIIGSNAWQQTGIAAAIWVTAGFFITSRLLNLGDLWMLIVGGIVAALGVGWMLNDEDETSTVQAALAAVIWVAAATSALSLYRGFGMSVVLLMAAATLIAMGRKRALLTIGPLALLAYYRLFREIHPDASRAFDIGQHYAMIGLLLGSMVPVLAMEWLRGPGKHATGRAASGVLWTVIFLAMPLFSAILLGSKGVVGYVVGLGLASVIDALKGSRASHSLSLAMGLAALSTLAYKWTEPFLDLARSEKLMALVWVGGGLAVVGTLVAVLSIRSKPAGQTS